MKKLLAAGFGLRTRLVAAFLFVAAVSAVTTATLTYREARSAILQQAQDTAVAQFRDRISARGIDLPPDPTGLRDMCLALARDGKARTWTVFAEYGDLRVSSSDRPTSTVITASLRAATKENSHGSFQRVVKDGKPWLTVGMPTLFNRGDGSQPTGLVLYAVMPLSTEEANVAAMVTAARDGALPALLIALVPALLAARSVLRPVRDLRRAAAGIGRGELHTRISVRGPTNSRNSPGRSTSRRPSSRSRSRSSAGPRNGPGASPRTSRTNCAPRSPACSPSRRCSTRTPPDCAPTRRRPSG